MPTGAREVPAADVYRSGDHYVVHCDLPGLDPGSLDVSARGDVVTVRAHRTGGADDGVRWLTRERPTGTVVRHIRLDGPVQGRNIVASYADGVLTLTVPANGTGPAEVVHVLHGQAA